MHEQLQLNDDEKRVWRFWVSFWLKHEFGPRRVEVSRGCRLSLTRVIRAEKGLISKGYLIREPQPYQREPELRLLVWPAEYCYRRTRLGVEHG